MAEGRWKTGRRPSPHPAHTVGSPAGTRGERPSGGEEVQASSLLQDRWQLEAAPTFNYPPARRNTSSPRWTHQSVSTFHAEANQSKGPEYARWTVAPWAPGRGQAAAAAPRASSKKLFWDQVEVAWTSPLPGHPRPAAGPCRVLDMEAWTAATRSALATAQGESEAGEGTGPHPPPALWP